MNKSLFFLAVGTLALTACTSEDVVDIGSASGQAIRFETAVSKSTRGVVDITTGSLTGFKVFGYYIVPGSNDEVSHTVFYDVPVTKPNGVWSYEDKYEQHWFSGGKYYFYAYSCGNVMDVDDALFGTFNVKMESNPRELEINNYISDYRHQHDFIFAKNYYEAEDVNGPVSFAFKHVLSKLQAKFTNTFPGEYDVVIKQITVDNIRNTGDFDFTYNWQDVDRADYAQPFVYLLNANGDSPEDASIFLQSQNNEDALEANKIGVSQQAYVIPFDYTALSSDKVYINIIIDVMLGDNVIIKGQPLKATLNPKWEEGHTYIYNIELNWNTINLGKIGFTIEDIPEWRNDDDDDINTSLDK